MDPRQIDELVGRGDVGALTELACSSDKTVAKAARRGLHQLRSRGLKVEAIKAPSLERVPSAVATSSSEMDCFASSFDANGERVIWLARSEPAGGVLVCEAVLSQSHGITTCRVTELARKAYRQWMRELATEHEEFTVAPVPWRWARAEVEVAYKQNQSTSRAAPAEFLRVRAQLGKAELLEVHPALDRWPKAEEVSREQALALHELPELRNWVPSREILERTAMKLMEVRTSPLLISPKQKIEAQGNAIERAVREYFSSEDERKRMRRRLLDTAYHILLRDPAREKNALSARAVSDHFDGDAERAASSPFAQRLFEKCFNLSALAPQEEPGPQGSPSGLILP